MKNVFVLCLFLLINSLGIAQERMIIYLKDKAGSDYASFTDRSLQRRQKNGVTFNDRDLTVSPGYIEQLNTAGKVMNTSRWLNAVSYETTIGAEQLKAQFSFILAISTIAPGKPSAAIKKDLDFNMTKSLDYGVADTQVRQIGADCLHDLGYAGSGIYFAVIDAGFKGMDTLPCFGEVFLSNRILDTHDFVNNLGVYDYSGHGTAVSSCIFGLTTGGQPFAGTAVDVDVALYVTEDVNSETPIEEFNLVAGLERCDLQGVDIANISLGYLDFDDPADNHVYADMDGSTTIAAIGVNTASSVGIVVVAAAGNGGPGFISTPCDANQGLCVGAVNNQGIYAPFSSVGPASDGQIKPDIAATGWNTWVYIDDGSLVMGNGTSFASPVAAGGIACLIQAHPWASVTQISEAVRQSANQFASPDEFLGYGIPDLCAANDALITLAEQQTLAQTTIEVFPNPATNHIFINGLDPMQHASILIYDLSGKAVFHETVTTSSMQISSSQMSNGIYVLTLDNREHRMLVIHRD